MTQDQLICTYVHIPSKTRSAHALYMLRRIASLVKPIMVQHGYKVNCLAEFYPVQKNLLGLNVNGGEKICIRLRQPTDDSVFLDTEDCVLTLLHEITHNKHGPHDERFYAHLKQLEEEYTVLRRTGYDGEGFYSAGTRLGTGTPRDPSTSDARRRALVAAEKRRATPSSVPGQRLGGSSPVGMGIREKIAAATERRIRDSQTCGAGSGASEKRALEEDALRTIRTGTITLEEEVEEAKEEEYGQNDEAILAAALELIEQAEREEAEQKVLWEERENGIIWIADDERQQLEPEPVEVVVGADGDLPPTYEEATTTTWQCEMCTLINPSILPHCEACSFKRVDGDEEEGDEEENSPPESPILLNPPPPPGIAREKQKVRFADKPLMIPEKVRRFAWTCANCTLRNDDEWWCCGACGVMKASS